MLRKVCLWSVAFLCFSMSSHSVVLRHVVVFGDSLSDTGNLYAYTKHKIPSSPPYDRGRFSNGPIWIDALAAEYSLLDTPLNVLNYAFGGAVVSTSMDESGLFTLRQEVDTYLLSHGDIASPDGLFVIWMGANNYLSLAETLDTSAVTHGIAGSIQRLIEHGATNFVVINLPDLGRSPAAKFLGIQDNLHQATEQHNADLQQVTLELQAKYPTAHVMYFDANTLLNDVFEHAAKYGFVNTVEACDGSAIRAQLSDNMIVLTAIMPDKISKSLACEGYLFFDPIHPTTQAHQLLVKHFSAFLAREGVLFGPEMNLAAKSNIMP